VDAARAPPQMKFIGLNNFPSHRNSLTLPLHLLENPATIRSRERKSIVTANDLKGIMAMMPAFTMKDGDRIDATHAVYTVSSVAKFSPKLSPPNVSSTVMVRHY
jgi:hypothetical protein